MSTLAKMHAIVAVAFKDKHDKGGRPYIEHCLRVMEAGRIHGDEVMAAFLAHDLLEDCPEWTPERLREEGFSNMTIRIIVTMTHMKDEPYDEYIKRIALEKFPTIGKRADLRDNMDVTRLKGLRRKDFERIEKYARSYTYLSD